MGFTLDDLPNATLSIYPGWGQRWQLATSNRHYSLWLAALWTIVYIWRVCLSVISQPSFLQPVSTCGSPMDKVAGFQKLLATMSYIWLKLNIIVILKMYKLLEVLTSRDIKCIPLKIILLFSSEKVRLEPIFIYCI